MLRRAQHIRHGNTPAEAGKTRAPVEGDGLVWKHPRRGGEDTLAHGIDVSFWETPPPRRGRRFSRSSSDMGGGNTPAEAGKTTGRSQRRQRPQKHPRRGGEDPEDGQCDPNLQETPPPRRGRPLHSKAPKTFQRNTPAEAGKTHRDPGARRHVQKHPRRGGEDLRLSKVLMGILETPPPRRGRQSSNQFPEGNIRNTPAEAGKTATYGSCLLK